jgi:segregation and condensation protein A
MSEYRVNLDIFAGPLDLLLYLVRKEEVDIYDIPIAHITEQYLKYIKLLEMFDIDLAGDFLVMSATLMEIKSAMLLPRTDVELGGEDMDDPRAELVRQLLEYKRFKDAANLLGDSAQKRKERFTRPDLIIAGLKKQDEPELDIDQVSVWTLLEAFDGIMQATGHYANYDHIKDDTPIDLYQIEILHRVQTEGSMTFERIFQGRSNRIVLMGLFLALLELIRDQLIYVEQAGTLGAIYLRSLTDEPAEKAVRDAIYSNVDLEDEAKADKAVQEPAAEAESEDAESERVEREAIPIQELPAEGVSNKSVDDNLAQVQHKDTFDEESDKSGPGQ